MKFYRLCETVQDYGKYIPENESIYNHINQSKPSYQSIYMYSEDQVKQAQEIIEVTKNNKVIKRPRGIVGMTDVVTRKLVWDFDSKDISVSQKDTQELVKRLSDEGISDDSLGIYFSGGKGFHVEVETDSLMTPDQFKAITSQVAKGLKTYDSVVSNPARIFRIACTKHNNSGYYKTRLTALELENSTVDEILEIAKEMYEPEGVKVVSLPSSFFSKVEEVKKEKVTNVSGVMTDKPRLDSNPLGLSNWKNALYQGFFPEGQRSNSLLILAATLKGRGMDEEQAYFALKASIEAQANRYNQDKFSKEEFFQNIVTQVFASTWQGGTYSEDNFPEELKEYLTGLGVPRASMSKLDEDLVVDVGQGMDRFFDYAQKIDENRMEFGIPELDKLLKPQVGHFVGLLGPAGSGKTSLALELLSSMSKKDIQCYFGSYDMNSNILFQKLLQRETGYTDDEIYEFYKTKNMEQIEKFKLILKKHYANVTFDFKVGSTIEGLKRSISKKEQELGEPIKLVVVDYIELIMSDRSDATQASAEAAQGLREIANSGKLVVVLLQPNKMSTKLDEAPKSYTAAKGSSSIAQAVTSMMGVFRPGYSPEDPSNDKYYGIAVLKNRMGPLGTCYFNWNGPRGLITSMEDIERQELAEFLAIKKVNKDNEGGL